jgi:hypothetical protein
MSLSGHSHLACAETNELPTIQELFDEFDRIFKPSLLQDLRRRTAEKSPSVTGTKKAADFTPFS